jgi:hypothetical protein
MKMKFAAGALAAAAIATVFAVRASALEPLTIGTSSLKDATLRLYGFVETDNIYDTTQSFTEEQGNNAVQRRTAAGVNNFAGEHARDQMTVRNSRLGLEFNVPAADNGLKAKAVFEMDFLGNNAPNTAPGGATPGTQSERDYYNNPAARVRHAYMDITKDEFALKIGQAWSLLGWQPYYFPGESVVQPGVGQLYRRFAQVRFTDTHAFGDWALESAADLAKPSELASGSPEYHGGLRFASTKIKGASISGAGTSMVGLSAAVSGAVIPVRTANAQNPTGTAYALNFLVPIIPSADGKDRSNTLIWAGEFMAGSGVGGLEYSGLSLGVPGVTNTAATGTAIDSGIAGLNNGGNVELIRYRAFRTHVQYSLAKWSVSTGYAQVEGRNLGSYAFSASIMPKIQYGYVSAFYDPVSWLRFAFEANQTRDTYNDSANRYAINNRYQTTAFFLF